MIERKEGKRRPARPEGKKREVCARRRREKRKTRVEEKSRRGEVMLVTQRGGSGESLPSGEQSIRIRSSFF